ncbi:hypothetical protein PC129_g9408 [Phytophthora cactorum]|uniref:Uncharacterized protein n=2 Tax=Phytophthora TaxID=4783 RepID=A0A329S855_9STRA|nr:hypothetical protein PC111_g10992 [Phytophthora cactorum]KAG2901304.1 hypothetical protein PC114_g13218 [Phytophthora cactorum]KAG2914613.1 hypothetical protein PC115_g11643 [Phytophthora cactorum]KAG2933346.1 hypothetical protein PC117_g12895 [Phytophthora cactorum]KAG2978189.1 hypothetical protein PC118_g12436 [Phytophthora cactorum]
MRNAVDSFDWSNGAVHGATPVGYCHTMPRSWREASQEAGTGDASGVVTMVGA